MNQLCVHNGFGFCRHSSKFGQSITDQDCLTCPFREFPEDLPPCQHKGSDRTCCSSLSICRLHKTDCDTQNLQAMPGVRVCKSCPDWKPSGEFAPRRNEGFNSEPWKGPFRKKPWSFEVTVSIPVIGGVDAISAIVELYRLQSVRPFIQLIDTGSRSEDFARIEALRAEDVEVHQLRFSGVKHPSDFPAIAMDLAFSSARTPFLLATHADCFPMSKRLVEELLEECRSAGVVGYQISPRPHSGWEEMVGHTLTMFDMKVIDQINGGWSLRRLVNNFDHPDGIPAGHEINSALSPNWPDTEILINCQLKKAGIRPLIIGTELNAQRTLDHRIDHCRSWASANLYSLSSDYAKKSGQWIAEAIRSAKRRADQWRSEADRDSASC